MGASAAAAACGLGPVTPGQEDHERPPPKAALVAPRAIDFAAAGDAAGDVVGGGEARGDAGQQATPRASADDGGEAAWAAAAGASGGGGEGAGSAAAAVDAGGGGPARWAQASHDDEEPILQPNSDRFCLLPIK